MCCARGAGWGAAGRPGPFLPSRSLHVLPARLGAPLRVHSSPRSAGRECCAPQRPWDEMREAGGGGGGGPDQGPAGRGRREDSLARVRRCKGHTSLVWECEVNNKQSPFAFPCLGFPPVAPKCICPGLKIQAPGLPFPTAGALQAGPACRRVWAPPGGRRREGPAWAGPRRAPWG